MAYSKRVTISKASKQALQALVVVGVTLGSLWLTDKAHIQLDEGTKTSIVLVVSTALMGTIEGLRNWMKHRKDK